MLKKTIKTALAFLLTAFFFSINVSNAQHLKLPEISQEQTSAVPVKFLEKYPILVEVIDSTWDSNEMPSAIAALIEQETCITPRHRFCWSERAEFKTSREYGFGLGQLTVTQKFNKFEEMKHRDPRLRDWLWEDRYNVENQMISIVVMMKRKAGLFSQAETIEDKYAFIASAYNCGVGGIYQDQRVCRSTPGCKQWRWFNHVENTSLKAKVAMNGYSKSFFQTNREHARNVVLVRSVKYKPFFDPLFPIENRKTDANADN